MAKKTLKVSETFKAPLELVYVAWLTPEYMKEWLAPGKLVVTQVENELAIGGGYAIQMQMKGEEPIEASGAYVDIKPYDKIHMTWQWLDHDGIHEVIVKFKKTKTGTRLDLEHRGLANAVEIKDHRIGWKGCFKKLKKALPGWVKSLKTKSIRQSVWLPGLPSNVYGALTQSKKHSAFTQSQAQFAAKKGGKFNAYDGYCWGVNQKLVKDKTIVQSWTCVDWPMHYPPSTVTVQLKKEKAGTRLTFVQDNVPVQLVKELTEGWTEHYWSKLAAYLETR